MVHSMNDEQNKITDYAALSSCCTATENNFRFNRFCLLCVLARYLAVFEGMASDPLRASRKTAEVVHWASEVRWEDVFLIIFAAFAVALFPLARGGWDLWSQTYFEIALLYIGAVWFTAKFIRCKLPVAQGQFLLVLGALACAYISCAVSPLNFVSWRALKWFAAGAGIIFQVPFSGRAGRGAGLFLLTLTGWGLSFLALYQFLSGMGSATGSYFNPNALAGFLVMFIPLAFASGHLLTAVIFSGAVFLTGSRGAVFSVAVTMALYLGLRKEPKAKIAGLGLALLAGAGLYFTSFASVSTRLVWWSSALDMFRARPWTGFGGGAFEYVYGALHPWSAFGLGTIFAHSSPLTWLAEYGLFAALLWFGFVAWRIIAGVGPEKWGLIAALILSTQDYTLEVPANFMAFCFLLSCGMEGRYSSYSRPEMKFPVAVRIMGAVAIIALCCGLCQRVADELKTEKKYLSVVALAKRADYKKSIQAAAQLHKKEPLYQAPVLFSARLKNTFATEFRDRTVFIETAAEYERALMLNPYNHRIYNELGAVYYLLGSKAYFDEMEQRKNRFIRWNR
jgi:O-antigen ligase